jgi:hypothetical protein
MYATCQNIIRPPIFRCVCLVSIQHTCHVSSCQLYLPCQLVPRVTLAVVPHVTIWLVHIYLPTSVPTHPATSVVFCMSCTVSCHINTVHIVWTIQSTFFFFFWPNEQIVISFTYDVCLSPFKLRWVHIDEAYAHVCFESILSTLIFRPSWTHFDP